MHKLTLKIVGATLTRDTDMIGKMDPFAIIEIGGMKF